MNHNKLLALSLALSASTIPCYAQDNRSSEESTSRRQIEEVIVTARKRSENIQETPVAVTAFSGDSLREQGIMSTQELSKSVPSLQINDSTSPQIFIRGIGQRAHMARFDPSVSVYIDGIFIPRPDGQLLDTIDIESVQVLRGPQGTLFGKNNTGGALVFNLTKPGDTFGGFVEGLMGNYDEQSVRAAVDLPIADKLLSRISLSSRRRDGFLNNIGSDNNQSIDRLSAIGQLRWDAADNITLDGLAFYGKIREKYPSYHCELINEDALFVNGLGILWSGDTDPNNPSAYRDNCAANNRNNLPDLTTNQGDSFRAVKAQDILLLGGTLDWKINENNTLKTIIGYRDATKFGPQTAADDGGPQPFLRALVLDDSLQESLTLEFQLNGTAFDGSLDYTAGFFWQDEYKSERFLTSNPLVGAKATSLAGLAAGQAGLDLSGITNLLNSLNLPDATPLIGGLLPLSTLQDFDINGQTYAAFTQATWHITDNIEWTLGGRYTEEIRKSDLITRSADLPETLSILSSVNPRFIPVVPDMGVAYYAGLWSEDPIQIANDILNNYFPGEIKSPLGAPVYDSKDSTFRQFTPMTSAAWILPEQWFDDGILSSVMVYGTWSFGFKSGFHEPSGVDGLTEIAPEELENREIGIKIDALERSLRMNIALYSMAFTNMQLITVNVDSANSLVVTSQNAGESTIDGGELEVLWLPSENMMLSFTYSNNNYKYDEFMDNELAALALRGEFVPVDRSKEDFAVSPETSASIGAQYTFITDYGLFTPRVDVSYKSEVYMGLDAGSWEVAKSNPDLIYASAYSLIDARLSWKDPMSDLRISAFVKNLADKRYDIGAVGTAESLGTFTRALGDPRTFGVELRKEF
ncbi:MAG: TonB-dependent receptor [Zhongshania sp.]|nr:TonB-dependent receptor [Zhongshania sp.]